MTDLDPRILSELKDLAEIAKSVDPKLSRAIAITKKDYELRALMAASVPRRGDPITARTLYWTLEKLALAQISFELGDEEGALQYLRPGLRKPRVSAA